MDRKFKIFLEIAKAFNNHDIVPILYGSLGLYRYIEPLYKVGDIDIAVPQELLEGDLSKLKTILNEANFEQAPDFPHEFIRAEERVGFESEESLKQFAGIDPSEATTTKLNGVSFRELSLSDYLAVYTNILKDWESKIAQHQAKIDALKKLIKN